MHIRHLKQRPVRYASCVVRITGQKLEAISKMHLALNGFVAIRFKMLTYYIYAPLSNRIGALPLSVIYYF